MQYNHIEDERREKNFEKIRHICICSCRVYIPVYNDSAICRWCGRKIYRTPQIEFKEKIKKILKERNI